MKIAVVGAGAMGCRYGAALAGAGQEVTLVDIWQEHIDAINRGGLEVTGPEGVGVVKVGAVTRADMVGVVDLLMVFTKSIHTEAAMKGAVAAVGPHTLAMTLQNGLGNIEAIEKFVPRNRIIAGVTDFPSDLLGPGRIKVTGVGTTRFQLLEKGDPRVLQTLQTVYEVFASAGLNPEMPSEIMAAIWGKVAFNAAINAVTAITRLSVGDAGQSDEAFDIMEEVVKEAVEVAACEGVRIDASEVLGRLKRISRMREHGDHLPSMLQDVLARKITEVASINGAIVARARKHGVRVPFNQCLYDLIAVIQRNYDRQR
ncbi:MAG: ketopantoate reductase family protein [Syntrophothermus sp.]